MDRIIQSLEASNGIKIPQLGFGVYKLKKAEEFEVAIHEAPYGLYSESIVQSVNEDIYVSQFSE
ncbi:hypothetical protein [Paenibacillus donghaensis]|uniref:NADP-dependent oxidoreductase domain-containing protein n=1 Tax=Paenibacillus donghaensis TaxID=414771 RepID=A0A2Z2KCI1_9BACL|nr:hypothetical protein [Paenibacillus donghaensis]ASA23317.1 hypothetical protein B9T62_22430 [Paenibacillus donghaensis]